MQPAGEQPPNGDARGPDHRAEEHAVEEHHRLGIENGRPLDGRPLQEHNRNGRPEPEPRFIDDGAGGNCITHASLPKRWTKNGRTPKLGERAAGFIPAVPPKTAGINPAARTEWAGLPPTAAARPGKVRQRLHPSQCCSPASPGDFDGIGRGHPFYYGKSSEILARELIR